MPKRKSSRLENDAPIAIIGCGIAGLGAAISLSQAGFSNLSLFERDASESSRKEGYGMTLSYNPVGPLARMGILEQLAQEDCPSRSHFIFDPLGTVLGYYGNAFFSQQSSPHRGCGQRGNLRIPRKLLQRIMVQKLESCLGEEYKTKIFWNHALCGISELGNGKVEASFCPLGRKGAEDFVVRKQFSLLIAADGIHSKTVAILQPQLSPRSLNIALILGISSGFTHPLLEERGFYTIDGENRLFVMPYQGDRYSSERRFMWQLSFPTTAEKCVWCSSRQMTLEKALSICSAWHDPVPSMIAATPISTVWGTILLDQDPMEVWTSFKKSQIQRVIVIGDALHGMSPFKGQGANQALLDGPLIADWLQNSTVDAAVRGIWREAVQRTATKVEASREAAQFWHSPDCVDVTKQQESSFAGIDNIETSRRLLHELQQRKVNANSCKNLDTAILEIVQELGIDRIIANDDKNCRRHRQSDAASEMKAIGFATNGETFNLRNLSLLQAGAIRTARDQFNRSCLHLAAANGHYETCRWLLHDAFLDPDMLDSLGKTPLDYAADNTTISNLIHQCKGVPTAAQ